MVGQGDCGCHDCHVGKQDAGAIRLPHAATSATMLGFMLVE